MRRNRASFESLTRPRRFIDRVGVKLWKDKKKLSEFDEKSRLSDLIAADEEQVEQV
jgi:hypothetical protein